MHKLALTVILAFCFLSALAKDFTIRSGERVKVYIPSLNRPVAFTALEMFWEDVFNVLGGEVCVTGNQEEADVIVSLCDTIHREGFNINVRHGKLYIAGGDEHGIAYGLLEISKMMGVSPWEYWADSNPLHLEMFTLKNGFKSSQYPRVAFRGIFINDEDWGINPWATRNEPQAWTIRSERIKGAIGPKVNERIFQLLLRLKANYYWPAMHECTQPFFTVEGNREMAMKYGIYIGGSHCEPMGTSPAVEWNLSGEGDYNYVTNRDNVQDFWRKRLMDVKDQEMVYTIGMRGVHDGAMQGVKTDADKLKYLQMVIDDQRTMLGKYVNDMVDEIPQVFVPYKEVLDTYRSGLNVPDDVTLMWTDDNYGYIRHFPNSTERSRKGGNGLYYHASYWGRPHDYLWLNSMPLDLMQNQLQCAYNTGIRQIWVLNVGDIKPSELQTEYFMEYAWKGQTPGEHYKVSKHKYGFKPFLEAFCEREFGQRYAKDITEILKIYFRQASLCKPEFMAGTRVEESDRAYWSQIRRMPGDWDKGSVAMRIRDYQTISDKAEELYSLMPEEKRDAFFQLVKYPVQAAAQMSFKFLCPDRCEEAFDSIRSLTHYYNKVCANGKWDGIMDCAPRSLPVFQKVTADMLPEYPDSSEWIPFGVTTFKSGLPSVYGFDLPIGTDSVTIQVRLLPTHPICSDSLSFAVRTDDGDWHISNYETHGRSEEWKQNVLRGYAERTFTLAIDKNKQHHTFEFRPGTHGVYLWNHEEKFFYRRRGAIHN